MEEEEEEKKEEKTDEESEDDDLAWNTFTEKTNAEIYYEYITQTKTNSQIKRNIRQYLTAKQNLCYNDKDLFYTQMDYMDPFFNSPIENTESIKISQNKLPFR